MCPHKSMFHLNVLLTSLLLLHFSSGAQPFREKTVEECFTIGSCISTPLSMISTVQDEVGCWHECRKARRCSFHTFFVAAQRCFLFENCDQKTDDCQDCTMGQITCVPKKGMDIVIVGGDEDANVTTIYDPEMENELCQLKNLPRGAQFKPFGGVVNDTSIMVCGGGLRGCYILNDSSWDLLFYINRQHSAAVWAYDHSTLNIFGGAGTGLINTFVVWSKGSSELIEEDMPTEIRGGCAVRVNQTHSILSGKSHYTYWYLEQSKTFEKMPNSDHVPSSGMACGLVFSEASGFEFVKAGGYRGSEFSEIYNIETEQWRVGEDLPLSIRNAASIQYQNSFLIIGGEGQSDNYKGVLRFTLDSGWVEMPMKLSKPNYNMAAFHTNGIDFCN